MTDDSNELVATTLDRIAEIVEELKYDDRWVQEILDIHDSQNRKVILNTIANVVGMIENEF